MLKNIDIKLVVNFFKDRSPPFTVFWKSGIQKEGRQITTTLQPNFITKHKVYYDRRKSCFNRHST